MGNFGGFTVRCNSKTTLSHELGVEDFLVEMVGRVVCDACRGAATPRGSDGTLAYRCEGCDADSPPVNNWRFDGLRDNFIDGFHEETFPKCKVCARHIDVTQPFVFWAYDGYTHYAFHGDCWPTERERLIERRKRNEEAMRDYESRHKGGNGVLIGAAMAVLALIAYFYFTR